MKRISAGLLCFLMVLLLSTPALAGNTSVGAVGNYDIPVTLTVDTSGMVDVSIQWDSMDFTYDGREVTPSGATITVANNNKYAPVTVAPEFILEDNMKDSGFALDFYDSKDYANRDMVTTETVTDSPVTIFVEPDVDKLTLAENQSYDIGKIRLTIDLKP